ncbi:MAG: hypothetical protein K9L17_08410 [Clostridiales bacterium]|nr:hypothetical protein [Clostridiales bacterium]MCF8022698.1 hypothetical protein [Clostridiales bacterium]
MIQDQKHKEERDINNFMLGYYFGSAEFDRDEPSGIFEGIAVFIFLLLAFGFIAKYFMAVMYVVLGIGLFIFLNKYNDPGKNKKNLYYASKESRAINYSLGGSECSRENEETVTRWVSSFTENIKS